MTIALIDLDSVIERLRTDAAGFLQFAGAAEFEMAADGVYSPPAAFVVPLRDESRPNRYADQIVQQEIVPTFSVVIAARNLADARGYAAVGAVQPLRESVMGALLGWTPGNCQQGCEFGGGRLRAFDNQVLWWEDTYRSSLYVRSQ